ncbi:hypothetical protein V8E54_005040 [Elaphomyces granulatus]
MSVGPWGVVVLCIRFLAIFSTPKGIAYSIPSITGTRCQRMDDRIFLRSVRASNYRDKQPMRYDIVCDRGQGKRRPT